MKPRNFAANEEYLERLRTVLDHIDAHLTEELSVETLAGVACFSTFHFHRLFTAFMGESLKAYIRRLRLERAALILRSRPEHSVTEIALDSGFSSSAVFARAFRQHFGQNASQWRSGQSKKGKAKSNPGKTTSKQGKDISLGSPYGGPGIENDHSKQMGGARMKLKVEIKDLEPVNMAYVRHHGGYDEKGIHEAYEALYRWAGPRGLVGPETLVLGLSLDDPDVTPMDKCRYDAGISVPEGTQAKGRVGVRELPGGRHAVIRFEGTKEGISGFYEAVYGQWLPRSGYQPANQHSYEIHLKPEGGQDTVPDCQDGDHAHLFDLYLPVEPV